ncbi:hypothetical protein [Alienimonas sp. DA493]|uniref:hypothetical protein n=1 Tax=Alienimonas sp. DA493 TaxID=3373605 RepID=UPI0037545F0A
MSPVRTAAAARSGSRRFARGLRFGWSRHALRGGGRRGVTSLGALAAYLIVVVTAPAWHHHDHAGHDHAHHHHAPTEAAGCCGHGHAHAGHEHHGHEHHGHEHHGHEPVGQEREEQPATCTAPAFEAPYDGRHFCPVCELLATPATPVTAPAVCDLGAARPTPTAPAAPDRRAVFLRTKHARGPPRV